MFLSKLLCIFIINFFVLEPVRAFDVSIQEGGGPICLNICFDANEAIYKDSIRISCDDPEIKVIRWNALAEAREEYVVPLKLHKKVYTDPFEMQVFLQPTNKLPTRLYVSCFIIENEEQVKPVSKYVLLSTHSPRSSRVSPVARRHLPIPQPRIDRSFRFLNTRILLWSLLFVLLVGFIIVDVLLFSDVAIIVFLLAWFFLSSKIIPYLAMLLGAIFFITIASIWFLMDYRMQSTSLRLTRFALGLLCASLILPLFVKIYFIVMFSKGCGL